MKLSSWNRRLVLSCWRPPSAAAFPAIALAQSYPQQPIKIIIPFAAGGGGDVVGRAVGEQLSELVGQPVVIENVAGAGGTLGTARAAKSPADGYTLFVGTPSTHGTNVAVYAKLPYDAIKDFEPVGLIATSPLMLIVIAAVGSQDGWRYHQAGAREARRTGLWLLRHRQHQSPCGRTAAVDGRH